MLADTMKFSSFTEDVGTLSDAEVLARSQKEPDLFAVLVRRYEAALLRRAKTILRSPEDAEEAVQDAFTKMYLYADKYHAQEGASFSSWAYTILNRVAYTKYVARRKENGQVAELEPEHYESLPDARDGGTSGCVETGAFGKEAYILTGYLNVPKVLELALNNGIDPLTGKQVGPSTGDAAAFTSFEQVYAAFEKQLDAVVDLKVRVNNYIERMCSDHPLSNIQCLLTCSRLSTFERIYIYTTDRCVVCV